MESARCCPDFESSVHNPLSLPELFLFFLIKVNSCATISLQPELGNYLLLLHPVALMTIRDPTKLPPVTQGKTECYNQPLLYRFWVKLWWYKLYNLARLKLPQPEIICSGIKMIFSSTFWKHMLPANFRDQHSLIVYTPWSFDDCTCWIRVFDFSKPSKYIRNKLLIHRFLNIVYRL